MSLLNRRDCFKVFLDGLQAAGSVVLASTVLNASTAAGAAPSENKTEKSLDQRANEVAEGQGPGTEDPQSCEFLNGAFRNGGGFRNGGFVNGGFRNGGFVNGGFRNGGFRNGGAWRN